MKNRKIMMSVALMLMLTIVSCQTERLSPAQLQLVGYSLKKTDLPDGWGSPKKDWGADFGGLSYYVIYQLDMHIFINHTISMHSSEDRAREAYKEWENNWFDVTNLQPSKLYSPLDEDDDYRYECLQIGTSDPLLTCIYLQRHNQLINFVKINFDTRNKNNPTFTQITDLLGVLDKRINETIVDMNVAP